ncbi:MAG: DUF2156 domain-containing protein [Agathobacter sp.]
MSEDFRPLTIDDGKWIRNLLYEEKDMACEYNFCTLFLWGQINEYVIARYQDRLLVRMTDGHEYYYLYPAGKGSLRDALHVLKEDARRNGQQLKLMDVTQNQINALEEVCPGRFRFVGYRDGWDYVYDIHRLAELSGKKLHAKRNHIHRFEEQYPNWSFEPVSQNNIEECLELETEWVAKKIKENGMDKNMADENLVITNAIHNWEHLNMKGGVLRANGKAQAFSLGSFTTPECFNVHLEKACDDIQGTYAMINREMARMIRDDFSEVKWINREDDLGRPGLRKAKMSYYPELLLEKSVAIEV